LLSGGRNHKADDPGRTERAEIQVIFFVFAQRRLHGAEKKISSAPRAEEKKQASVTIFIICIICVRADNGRCVFICVFIALNEEGRRSRAPFQMQKKQVQRTYFFLAAFFLATFFFAAGFFAAAFLAAGFLAAAFFLAAGFFAAAFFLAAGFFAAAFFTVFFFVAICFLPYMKLTH